jgi:hypothetical protein
MNRKIFSIPIEEVLPPVAAVLEGQGIPRWKQANGITLQLARDAVELYREKARPVGAGVEIAKDAFKPVFEGEGRNEPDSPVGPIFQASENLALFAVTIGQEICSEIRRLFRTNDFALGSMLDSAASEGTELTARAVEKLYLRHLKDFGFQIKGTGVLRFSPGYCGWHISAQKKLFDALHPSEIGITLNESHLMQPLKSISGVIISGEKNIFYFDDTFSFCRDCAEHSCRERIHAVTDHEE